MTVAVPSIAVVSPTSADHVAGVQSGAVKLFAASPPFTQLAATTGASLVGFSRTEVYAAGTVGAALKDDTLPGGTTGQLRAKASNTDYDEAWVDPPNSAVWGLITGTLSGQTDLQAAFDGKVPTSRTVNGHALSANVTVTASDLGLNAASVAAVAADLTNVDTVAGISANVTTVAGISANVTTVAAHAVDVSTVAPHAVDISTVAPHAVDVTTVAGSIASVNTVAGDVANINIVAGDHASIAALGPISANITVVAGDLANVNAVAADVANVNAVAGDLTAINSVAADLTAINGASGNAAATAADVVSANALLVSTQSLFNRIYLGAF